MTIEELEAKLSQWRKNKKSPKDRIPEEIWAEAMKLAKKSSISSVAGRLNLNNVDLQKRMGITKVPKKKLAFKELAAPVASDRPLFEITTASGTTLKVYQ